MDKSTLVPALRRELEEVIIKVNYHYQSGYERHVNLQKPESIFLNFLKKKVTLIPASYLFRLKNREFTLSMDQDQFITNLVFNSTYWSHWDLMKDWIKVLEEARLHIDFDELKDKSHTLDKFYQQTNHLINSVKDYQFKF